MVRYQVQGSQIVEERCVCLVLYHDDLYIAIVLQPVAKFDLILNLP